MDATLERLAARFSELESLIQQPEIMANSQLYRKYLKEHGALAKTVGLYRQLQKVRQEKKEAQEILASKEDEELCELAREELTELKARETELWKALQLALISDDEEEDRNVIVEIRAGTGGEEASLFAADLFKMYAKFAEKMHWKVEVLDSSPSELGGFNKIIFSVEGKGAYRLLQYESGGHRVQRIPVTESSGRIHTSACTVAVLPEAQEVEVEINPKDLKIETIRASGPGGQNVNKTSSAVRITHLPTEIVVSCQDTPEQHKNKMKAMRILRSRLYEKMMNEQHAQRNALRRLQHGSGDRSQRIRTYNFPQNRITDHRINYNIYALENFLLGDLDELLEQLQKYAQEEKLKQLNLQQPSTS